VGKFDLVACKFDSAMLKFSLGQVQNCVCFLWGVIFTHCVARVPPVR